jgi:CubicO group peptidase (beta-lactamase class C family)
MPLGYGIIVPRAETPEGVGHRGFDPLRLAGIRQFLEAQVDAGAFPGGVLVVGDRGGIAYHAAVGRYGEEDGRPVSDTTVYDMASLTKVVGLTTAAMLMAAEGRLDLDRPVQAYLPEFRGAGKEHVLVRHLLTHTSGLPAWAALYEQTETPDEAVAQVLATPLDTTPGTRYVYSDLGAITMGKVVEAVAGEPLDALLERRVFRPLGMRRTRFLPPADWIPFIAPTERDPWRGRLIRGEVHDENAARLGGISGHAGLFSNGPDLARFARWLLDVYHDRDPGVGALTLPADLVRDFVARQPGPEGSTRAVGWDTPSADGSSSAGTRMAPTSFGHTGFTGTSIWMDPEREVFIILLTNRVHPTRENRAILRLRGVVADSVMAALVETPVGGQ